MNISFRRALPEDAENLVQVQIAAFHHDSVLYPGVSLGGPPGYDSVESTLRQIREMNYYTIRFEERIIGGVGLRDVATGHIHLDLLYIDPEFHNLGLGTLAIEFLESTHPATKWTLDTPDYAVRNQHFYQKFGYVRVGEKPVEDFVLLAYEKNLE